MSRYPARIDRRWSATTATSRRTSTRAAAEDNGCTQAIIRRFGAVAWQRPVSDAEVSALLVIAANAGSMGDDFPQAMAEVVKAMMVSAPFLYRVEGV